MTHLSLSNIMASDNIFFLEEYIEFNKHACILTTPKIQQLQYIEWNNTHGSNTLRFLIIWQTHM